MELSGLEHLIYGLVYGLTEIFPISSRAHIAIMLKLLGAEDIDGLPVLLMRIAALAASYLSCQSQLAKMARARRLARIPKKRRKRPLDLCSLMDSRFLLTMLVPVILMDFLYQNFTNISFGLLAVSVLLFVNGILLYIPQFLPGCNKDARSLSRIEGLMMGVGGCLSVIPGFSGLGASISAGSICGVERSYALNMSLMMNMAYLAGMSVYDIGWIIQRGFGTVTFGWIIVYILAAALSFAGAWLAIRIMRVLASDRGYSVFSYYCWGIALFTFILNLMA